VGSRERHRLSVRRPDPWNGSDNVISGGGGSDWIGGGGGEDVVSGGLGHDRADVDRSDRVSSATDVGAPPYHDPCLG
jgi:Ca2+-binding RTX toxin-like protein